MQNNNMSGVEKLADVLNMHVDASEVKTSIVSAEVQQVGKIDATIHDSDTDYNLVRKNLQNLINTSEMAIEGIMSVATEGDSPRAFEVVSELIKTSLEANNQLIQLHKNMKELKKQDKNSVKADSITNNSIFVGSTNELLKMIKQKKIEPVVEPKINNE